MPYSKIDVGVRYVFYSSLLNEEKNSLRGLGARASNIIHSEAGSLSSSANNETETKMDQVIKLLQIALLQEQQAEKNFLTEKIINNPIFSPYKNFLQKIKACASPNGTFDYITFTSALNIALQGIDNFNKNNELELQRIEEITRNIKSQIQLMKTDKNMSEDIARKELSEAYIRHGGTYDKQYKAISDGVTRTLAGQRAIKVQTIIEKILNEYRYRFIELANGKFYNVTDQDILDIIITPLTTAILTDCINEDNLESELQNLIDQEYNLPNLINENKAAKLDTSFKVKKDRDSNLFKGDQLTNTFLTLFDEGEDEAIRVLDKYLIGDNPKSKGKNFETLIKELNSIPINNVTARASKKGAISKKIKYQLNKPGVYNEIHNALKNVKVKISRPDESEIIAGAQAALYLSGSTVSVEGKNNLKNDFVITVNFPDDLLKNVFNSIEKDFLSQVKREENLIREAELSSSKKNTTNINATTALYNVLLTIEKTKKKKQNSKNSSARVRDELNSLKKSFYIQGSAKDLMTYDNEIGFVGGTLGSKWDIAVDNLLKMYEKGGISVVDKNWLLTAIMNTSSSSLGYDLKSPIEQYLSFAAAMMMFGQGGSQMILAGEQLNNNIKIRNKPNIMNLYFLNSNYYPASLVLQIILNNLTKVYTSLISVMSAQTQNKTGVKIINNSRYGMVSGYEKMEPLTSWEKHGEMTEQNLNIEFTFLAGILDILEKLQGQMNNLIA